MAKIDRYLEAVDALRRPRPSFGYLLRGLKPADTTTSDSSTNIRCHCPPILTEHLPTPLAVERADLLKPVPGAIEHRGNLGGSVAAQKTDQLAD
jgi:hypothetical protein